MVDKQAIIIKAKLAALNAIPASDIYSESVMMPLVDVWHIGWTPWRLRASRPLRYLEQTNQNPNNTNKQQHHSITTNAKQTVGTYTSEKPG